MSITDHLEYFEQRRLESVERAENTRDPALAHIYREFANHYTRVLLKDGENPSIAAHSRRSYRARRA
nr:hypothetical protein [Sphingomonas sp. Y57]